MKIAQEIFFECHGDINAMKTLRSKRRNIVQDKAIIDSCRPGVMEAEVTKKSYKDNVGFCEILA
jgi:hypothetical protein